MPGEKLKKSSGGRLEKLVWVGALMVKKRNECEEGKTPRRGGEETPQIYILVVVGTRGNKGKL